MRERKHPTGRHKIKKKTRYTELGELVRGDAVIVFLLIHFTYVFRN